MRVFLRTALLLFTLLAALPALAGENMIGRQTHNEGLLVLPAPGEVKVDGDLSDWDWSGRIWVFAELSMRDRYSVEAAAMWDANYLYLAAKWLDPTPMVNHVNPDNAPDDGWKSDSWQVRIKSDTTVHFTNWYYTDEKTANMHVTYSAKGRGGNTFVIKGANGAVLEKGVQMGFKQTSARGYSQEIRIPWSMVFETPPTIEPGVNIRMGNEFLWGDVTGKTWPGHRYADNMQPGVTSREFYWQNFKAWGDATLMATGNVPLRQYVPDAGRLEGTLPIRAEIPEAAVRVSLAINDAAGRRVRNLAGDVDPRDYTVAVANGVRTIELPWDCLDDDGQPVPPGTYSARGLTHGGLSASYDMTFYNPGTPPWHTADGTGAWGSNHNEPRGVARAGDRMILYWQNAEGGHAVIAVGADGRKVWGELRGGRELAADEKSVYYLSNTHEFPHNALLRLDAADGSYKAFVLDGKPREYFLTIAEILGTEMPGEVTSIASNGAQLAIAFSGGEVALLDSESAMLQERFKLAGVQDLAYGPGGALYALAGGKLLQVDLKTKATTAIATPGLGEGTRLTVTQDGSIAIVDSGADSQVKVYSAKGELVRSAGTKGGRPWSGLFDPQAMMQMSSVAEDAKGQLWVAESWKNPRRYSVWGQDGKLVRDYIGGTGYAGTGTWLDEHDPAVGYVGPVELKLNHEDRSYSVTRILWAPDETKGQAFPLWRAKHWYSNPHAIVSEAAGIGKPVRYIYHNGVYASWHAVFIDDGVMARPVAAIAKASYLAEALPGVALGEVAKNTIVFWNDLNGDTAVTADECTVGPEMNISAFWGSRIAEDLTIYVDDGKCFKPTSFTKNGAPVYGLASITDAPFDDKGEYLPVQGDDLVVVPSKKGYPGPSHIAGYARSSGKELWTYPNLYPGVHGSHRAPMPEAGLLIGTLRANGIADMGGDIGKVFSMRGNLGQDYFMTTDGLFIGSLFQDTRFPSESLPATEAELADMPMEGFSEGGEPFSGWMVRQDDGVVRLLTSMSRTGALIAKIHGLDGIKRFEGIAVPVSDAALAQAIEANAARVAAAAGAKTYTISSFAKAPKIDGKTTEWKNLPMLLVEREGSPNRAEARLAYDDTYLYLAIDVADPSPWLNSGKDPKILFKTGDAVDIQIGPGNGDNGKVVAGDQRIVFGASGGKPVALLMRAIDGKAKKGEGYVYSSPVTDKHFDRVQLLDNAQVVVVTSREGYVLEAAVPLADLGLRPRSGQSLGGDLGIITSDAGGTVNTARTYWSNKETNLVNDLPLEAVLVPKMWGTFTWQ